MISVVFPLKPLQPLQLQVGHKKREIPRFVGCPAYKHFSLVEMIN